jgi:hypothetical protein
MRESSMDPLNNHSYASMMVGAQLVWGVLFSVRVSINISVGPHSDSSSPLYLRACTCYYSTLMPPLKRKCLLFDHHKRDDLL